MKKILLILLALITVRYVFLDDRQVTLGSGVYAAGEPVQAKSRSASAFRVGEYTVMPLADFAIEAKVLSRKDYSFGREADLSPVDLALGWGRMSDEDVLAHINISQSSRWYRWHTDSFPIPRREIETHSANMHLIPANDEITDRIRKVRKGEIIALSGKLVRVDADDGWRWISSLSRDDTGASACELIWVEEFRVIEGRG